MKSLFIHLCLILALPLSALSASVDKIESADSLAGALAQATAGDILTLSKDIEWSGPKPIAIPSGVILEGKGRSINNTGKGALLNQENASDVVLRNLNLSTTDYMPWTLAVKNGSLRFENCTIQCRLISWETGAIELVNCKIKIEMPAGSDNNEPVGVYGSSASFSASMCLFEISWKVQHVGTGFFHNFGGNPASRLSLNKCTIIGGQDRNYNESGRHQSILLSDNSAGKDYVTSATDCIFLAEVKSVFRSTGQGKATSFHNNNAGMLRNPGILTGGSPEGTSFYQSRPEDIAVENQKGDIEEPNPFADVPNGDYRILTGTLSATAASDGGPLGSNPNVIPKVMNAYNLNLTDYVPVTKRTPGFQEVLFDGWPVRRDTDQQHSRLPEDGLDGISMRLETFRNDEGTGGPGQTLTQNAYQTFVTVPGVQYTISAWSRRSAVPVIGNWEENGNKAIAILGIAEGFSPKPDKLIASTTFDGPENTWITKSLTLTAPSYRLTLHLIHQTDGSWNRVDWDAVTIKPHIPLDAKLPKGLPGPVLGYINTIPPESKESRAARHKKVAERRANNPIIIHRGAHKFDPENTLEAYDRAMALGADGVEFDPHISKDGVIYTFHDGTVDRMLAGGGEVKNMTYYDIVSLPFKSIKGNATKMTRVPTIISLFQLARERAMLLHVDIKEPGIEDMMITLFDQFDMWDHMVWITYSDDSNRLRQHPKTKLLNDYKPNPDYNNPESVKNVMAGPGEMMWCDADPTFHVKGLGRPVPGEQPLPDGLRAWWWPDGSNVPVKDSEINKTTSAKQE